MKLAVIGCGKMGLPIAVQAASCGLEVIGVDVNEEIVAAINEGESLINEPGIETLLENAVNSGKLKATTNLKVAVSQVDAIIVIVPVLLTNMRKADLATIKEVTTCISQAMKPKTTVCYETTLPVGTTRNILLPILEKNGMKVEKDFYLVFSPERVKSLSVIEKLNSIPKVVGGAGPVSVKKGMNLYKSILQTEILNAGTLENAEMVKIAGMIYRDVNIALVNEMSRYCDMIGVNLPEIIPFVNTNGEANLLRPGIGVGGHCTPVYPYFLINDAHERNVSQLLAETARDINDGQAEYYMQKVESFLGNFYETNVLILGLAFRSGVKEGANSTAYLLRGFLEKHGANVYLFDPVFTQEEIEKHGFAYKNISDTRGIDVIVLITAHDEFLRLNFERFGLDGVKVFVDGRNAFNPEAIERFGIKYFGIGQG